MHKSLQFLAKKSVLLFGAALAILANPLTYMVIGSLLVFTKSSDNPSVSYNTQDQFIQAMILTSGIGFAIIIVSRASAWILAYRKIKSSKHSKSN
jgi:hypothetical protein